MAKFIRIFFLSLILMIISQTAYANLVTNGTLFLNQEMLFSTTRNYRADYSLGEVPIPENIKELTNIIASINALVRLSGGSYDEISSYSLGSKSITLGQIYINLKETIAQYKERAKELLDLIGRGFSIKVL